MLWWMLWDLGIWPSSHLSLCKQSVDANNTHGHACTYSCKIRSYSVYIFTICIHHLTTHYRFFIEDIKNNAAVRNDYVCVARPYSCWRHCRDGEKSIKIHSLVAYHDANSKVNKGFFCTGLLIMEQLLCFSIRAVRLRDKQSGVILHDRAHPPAGKTSP